jgi:hypothetical protein
MQIHERFNWANNFLADESMSSRLQLTHNWEDGPQRHMPRRIPWCASTVSEVAGSGGYRRLRGL